MTISEIKEKVEKASEYAFLRNDPHKIALMTMGGSYAYGTNHEGSDIDIRGVALNTPEELLLGEDFEEIINVETDTVLYSYGKILQLLSECNPNTIEMLGTLAEHYLKVSPEGQLLLDHRDAFISRTAVHSFGGYAISQLRRLENLSVRETTQERREEHILESIQNAMENVRARYADLGKEDRIRLYIDRAVNPDLDTEIFLDTHLTHYPLRDYRSMWNDFNSIVKSYNKIGKRNSHAVEHKKIGKHMMHLIRLFMMGLDILEKGEIRTYRGKGSPGSDVVAEVTGGAYTDEYTLLMDIRNNRFVTEDNQVLPEFYDILEEYEKRFDQAKEHTSLPEKPDLERIRRIKLAVNRSVITGEDILGLRREYGI